MAIVQRSVPQIVNLKIWVRFPLVTLIYYIVEIHAVCPGGEGAVLKTVGLKRWQGPGGACYATIDQAGRRDLAGSNLSSADSVGAEQCPQDTSTLCTALNGQVTRNW